MSNFFGQASGSSHIIIYLLSNTDCTFQCSRTFYLKLTHRQKIVDMRLDDLRKVFDLGIMEPSKLLLYKKV